MLFDDGVIVIKHWRINNYLQKDRYVETKYVDDKKMLEIDDNKAYRLGKSAAMYTQVSIVKDSIDNNIYGDSDSKNDMNEDSFFESLWALYPKKKGKASVSKTQRKKLQKLGYDTLVKCIDNYKEYISSHGVQDQYVMYGSSFFNKGYVDYLPDDDVPTPIDKPKDGDWE